jgi:hypothetical protein
MPANPLDKRTETAINAFREAALGWQYGTDHDNPREIGPDGPRAQMLFTALDALRSRIRHLVEARSNNDSAAPSCLHCGRSRAQHFRRGEFCDSAGFEANEGNKWTAL